MRDRSMPRSRGEPARQRRDEGAAGGLRRAVIALGRAHLEERIELDRTSRARVRDVLLRPGRRGLRGARRCEAVGVGAARPSRAAGTLAAAPPSPAITATTAPTSAVSPSFVL